LGPATIGPFGPRFHLLRTFDLAPPSGRAALGGRFPGLKPWAEFRSPCGAQNKGLNQGLWPTALSSEQNHPKPYLAPFGAVPNLSTLTGVCPHSKISQGSVPNRGGWRRSVANSRPQRGLSPFAVGLSHIGRQSQTVQPTMGPVPFENSQSGSLSPIVAAGVNPVAKFSITKGSVPIRSVCRTSVAKAKQPNYGVCPQSGSLHSTDRSILGTGQISRFPCGRPRLDRNIGLVPNLKE
jgi:hypothetical protein